MKKTPKILVVGSINMDMICTAVHLPSNGETLSGMSFSTAAGGKGANQAVAAARLGADVTLVGNVGNDAFGKELLDRLASEGIDISHVRTADGVSTGVADIQVEIREDGAENRILVIGGANENICEDDVAFLKEGISEYDMLILQNEIPTEINLLVAKYAHDKNIPVMLNPAPSKKLPWELYSYCDYIAPNEHEAKDMTGYDPKSQEQQSKAIGALLDTGAKHVLITLGADGCVYSDGVETILSPSVSLGKVVDPTAAGDSFIGAFSYAISSGKDARSALMFANYTAGITVCRMGAQPSLPSLSEVEEKLHNAK